MEFTAKAMADANEMPVLRVPVRNTVLRYEGRLLSAPQWLVFWDRYVALSDRYTALKDMTVSAGRRQLVALERETHLFYIEYLRTVFPPKRFLFWAPDPVKLLARGHPSNLREAFDAFFSLQARAMGRSAPTSPSLETDLATPTTNSLGSTVEPPVSG